MRPVIASNGVCTLFLHSNEVGRIAQHVRDGEGRKRRQGRGVSVATLDILIISDNSLLLYFTFFFLNIFCLSRGRNYCKFYEKVAYCISKNFCQIVKLLFFFLVRFSRKISSCIWHLIEKNENTLCFCSSANFRFQFFHLFDKSVGNYTYLVNFN